MRTKYLDHLEKMVTPYLNALANDTLKSGMTVESKALSGSDTTYLEGLGRILCGLTPFLFSKGGDDHELKVKKTLLDLTVNAIENALDPKAKDYVFVQDNQPVHSQNLVDIAFLGEGLLRAKGLWDYFSPVTRQRLIHMLRRSREVTPGANNWLLFSGMVEITLYHLTGEFDQKIVDHALTHFDAWYKGDGIYGDGAHFAFDYYNSLVIHPMLLEIVETLRHIPEYSARIPIFKERSMRYAAILERMIAPDGTFPAIGRSLAYRCGAFHLLAMMAWRQELPESLGAAQVRCALLAVMDKTLNSPGTYSQEHFLQIGLSGHQPKLGEVYISTGSLYLASAVFLVLGLSPEAPFWREPDAMWTSCNVFTGLDLDCDKAIQI